MGGAGSAQNQNCASGLVDGPGQSVGHGDTVCAFKFMQWFFIYSEDFTHVYNVKFCLPHPLAPLTQFFLPTQLHAFFSCCFYTSPHPIRGRFNVCGCGAIRWYTGHLPVATVPKRNDAPSCQLPSTAFNDPSVEGASPWAPPSSPLEF